MIEIRKLSRSFGNLRAVDELDLDVENEIFGLLGPNGAGKSTTVMMLTTLLRPSSGTAKVCGYDIVKDSKKVRSKISYVPQDMAVDRKLTGRENVMLYAKLYGIQNRNSKVDEVIEMMGLSDRAGDLVAKYSGGMRRRRRPSRARPYSRSAPSATAGSGSRGSSCPGRRAGRRRRGCHTGAPRRRGSSPRRPSGLSRP